jgi:hypothetical protein
MDEVELLLALVVVPAGGVARRDGDHVHAELSDVELPPQLAEAIALTMESRSGATAKPPPRVTSDISSSRG